MILNIDTDDKDFQVTRMPSPKLDGKGDPRVEKGTGQPLWSTELVVTDDSGGEIIKITTAGEAPDVKVSDPVEVYDLIAFPWATNGRSGIAFKAREIRVYRG